ncbi:MAG: CehA/McbA family metallohydrolase [Chloroflexi bacterium]|nr:CehA/McbA family metallohydrolase [Chloroflexota bacterium]
MPKFTQIDLSSSYSHRRTDGSPWDADTAEAIATLPGGENRFWGIPFSGRDANAPSIIVVGADGGSTPVEIAIDGAGDADVPYVVIQHVCDGRALDDDGHLRDPYPLQAGRPPVALNPGELLAEYTLIYADGSEHTVPIRRQFEINNPRNRSQSTYAAKEHLEPVALDFRGPSPRNLWGRMQLNVNVGALESLTSGQGVWLIYALANPHPDRRLKWLRVSPTGRASIGIGAITLFHGDNHPLRHSKLESVVVDLPDGDPADPEVDIDLGTVARSYAVPAFDADAWLAEDRKGWGDEVGGKTSLMLDIAANPDATLSVGGHEFEMASLRESGEVTASGGLARIRLLTPERQWVHTTIVDAATGRPTPARIHFRAPDGRYIPPYGHRHEVNDNWFEDYGADLLLGSTQYAYVDGKLQGELPVGDVYVEVVKGFEYAPVRKKLQIEPGQREVRIELERITETRPDGWVTADTHTHFLTPETARLEAAAEDVNLINLLAAQWGDLFTNVGDLTGALSGSSTDETLVWVGTENRQHLMGHINLLAYTGSPIYPLSTGGPSEGYIGDSVKRSMSEWAEECRRKEGVVVVPHFPFPESEVYAEVIRGVVDGLEIRDFWSPSMDTFAVHEWYQLLNAGYRVAAVGGTDKMSASMPVGGVRTYAHIGDEEFSFASWGRALRAGKTVTTAGPILSFTADGRVPGDELKIGNGGGTVHIEVSALSASPIHTLDVVFNGRVVASESSRVGALSLSLSEEIRIEGSGWLAARCGSENVAWHVWPVNMNAHTSPVYVVAEGSDLFQQSAGEHLITVMQGGLEWLDTLAIPESPERHEAIKKVFHDAIHDVRGKMEPAGHGVSGHTH